MTLDPTVVFLTRVQELLGEGSRSSTYKFALLQAIADLCVEKPLLQDGHSLPIHLHELAKKFAAYYWMHDRPFSDGGPLRQNNSKRSQLAILSLLQDYRRDQRDSLACLQEDSRMINKIAATIKAMPIKHLQNVGGISDEFIYCIDDLKRGPEINIFPTAVAAFRRFHPIFTQMIRGAWMDKVRALNTTTLGSESELWTYLFGAQRSDLSGYSAVLREHQDNRCFYCEKKVQAGALDHFIAWKRYPMDLGHNFVFAHTKCNSAKSDFLAAPEHVSRWLEQNIEQQEVLSGEFRDLGLRHDVQRTIRVAEWAYEQGAISKAPLWTKGTETVSFDDRALNLLRTVED